MRSMRISALLWLSLLAPVLLAACNDGASAGVKATSDALSATIQAQATQAAEVSTRQAVPPTATVTPATPVSGGQSSGGPGDVTPVADSGNPAQATPASVDPAVATQIAYATQAALSGQPLDPAMVTAAAATQAASANIDPAQATAQAAAQSQAFDAIKAQLPTYGVDPAQGSPGWTHPSVTINARGKDGSAYANDNIQLPVKDFVLSADITWNTRYGDSGCGFFVRSNGNSDRPSQYTIVITRGSNGHMIFTVMVDGEVLNAQDVYANGIDERFQVQNDTTNNLTVVGRAGIFTIYSNGTKLGDMDPRKPPKMPPLPEAPQPPSSNNTQEQDEYQNKLAEYNRQVERIKSEYQAALRKFNAANVVFDQGLVAMFTVTQGGDVQCKFDNAWLWIIQ